MKKWALALCIPIVLAVAAVQEGTSYSAGGHGV
jgi:hypothetical protein